MTGIFVGQRRFFGAQLRHRPRSGLRAPYATYELTRVIAHVRNKELFPIRQDPTPEMKPDLKSKAFLFEKLGSENEPRILRCTFSFMCIQYVAAGVVALGRGVRRSCSTHSYCKWAVIFPVISHNHKEMPCRTMSCKHEQLSVGRLLVAKVVASTADCPVCSDTVWCGAI